MKVDLSPIIGEEVKTKAKRPKYSALENGHLKKLGMDNMRPWDQALKAYLIEQGRLTN